MKAFIVLLEGEVLSFNIFRKKHVCPITCEFNQYVENGLETYVKILTKKLSYSTFKKL